MLLTFFFEGEKEERERERERTSLNRRHEEKEQETLLRGIHKDRPPFLHREQILFDALCPDSNQRPTTRVTTLLLAGSHVPVYMLPAYTSSLFPYLGNMAPI
jgi:hypothetical protein